MKQTKEDIARIEGMAQALRIAKKSGIDGLETELKARNILNWPLNIPKDSMEKFVDAVKQSVYEAFLVMTVATLHDEFGFEQKELSDFMTRINQKSECISDEYCSWKDMADTIKEECGIELKIDHLK